MTILLAVGAGIALGYVFERGDFCFHSTWRGMLRVPRQGALLKAYLLLLLISTPIVQLLIATDVINPFIPRFTWQASIVGGGLFGIGMVIAATCITGMFYKLGHGMLGMFAALAAWFAGDVVAHRGPLQGLRDDLRSDPIVATNDGVDEVATVTSLFGPIGVVLLVAAGVAVAWYLWRSHTEESGATPRGPLWGWLPLGAAAAAVMTGTWLLVRWHGFDYTFGTSGTPNAVWGAVVDGDDTRWWIPLALVSLIPGALIAAWRSKTLRFRGETPARFAQLIVGGAIMGVGAGIAGGCNLGHSMVGVPLLSMGSISATLSMIAGLAVAHFVSRAITDRRSALAAAAV